MAIRYHTLGTIDAIGQARGGIMAATLGLRGLFGPVLETVFPARCLGCTHPVDHQGGLCPRCWSNLSFITPPVCAQCGLPFDLPAAADTVCGACLVAKPPFARARALWRYDSGARPLILGFKHGDQTFAAPAFAAWLARAGAELLDNAACIVPVPLHPWRLVMRRYNQAALLARAVAAVSGLPFGADWLRRTRPTPSQGGLDRSHRHSNVRGAFALTDRGRARVAGQRVVLIDDVLTTGATASECARTLLRAGAEQVDVLALARVV